MINIKETIQLIKTDEKFRQVFHFETDSKKNFNYMLPDKELREQFSFVNWIYMSTLSQATLIGTLENGEVFTMDDEGSTFILCNSFFEIPFNVIDIYFMVENPKDILHNNPKNKEYLENLKFYSQWCTNNNITINDKYLDILKS